MSVIGLWKLVAAKGLDMQTFEELWKTNEDIVSAGPEDMLAMMANAMFEFKEGGVMTMLCNVKIPEGTPESEIEAAIASGEVIKVDGELKLKHDLGWKEVNGELFTDNGERGEVFGEAIDPWKKAEVLGNTLILDGRYQIVKADETPSEIKKTVKEVKQVSAETAAAAGNYKGLYTKFVGDPDESKNDKEPFHLELNPDGTGKSFRNDLEIKIPDWSFDAGVFKMTEKFLGTIDYTGSLDGNRLVLYNGDPENALTCQYVFEKE